MAEKKKNKKKDDTFAAPSYGGDTGGGEASDSPNAGYYRDPSGLLGNPIRPYYDPGTGKVGYSQYHDGDQDEPYGWGDPDQVAGLQSMLVAAGLLSKKGLRPGMWDPDSASAYKKALSWANNLGISVDELLSQLLDGADFGGGGGGGGGGGLGLKPISDEDITALAQKVSAGVLGRDLRPEEIGNFIPAFRGIYEAQETTPQVGAENLIRKEIAPQGEADAHQVGNVMNVIQKALGG